MSADKRTLEEILASAEAKGEKKETGTGPVPAKRGPPPSMAPAAGATPTLSRPSPSPLSSIDRNADDSSDDDQEVVVDTSNLDDLWQVFEEKNDSFISELKAHKVTSKDIFFSFVIHAIGRNIFFQPAVQKRYRELKREQLSGSTLVEQTSPNHPPVVNPHFEPDLLTKLVLASLKGALLRLPEILGNNLLVPDAKAFMKKNEALLQEIARAISTDMGGLIQCRTTPKLFHKKFPQILQLYENLCKHLKEVESAKKPPAKKGKKSKAEETSKIDESLPPLLFDKFVALLTSKTAHIKVRRAYFHSQHTFYNRDQVEFLANLTSSNRSQTRRERQMRDRQAPGYALSKEETTVYWSFEQQVGERQSITEVNLARSDLVDDPTIPETEKAAEKEAEKEAKKAAKEAEKAAKEAEKAAKEAAKKAKKAATETAAGNGVKDEVKKAATGTTKKGVKKEAGKGVKEEAKKAAKKHNPKKLKSGGTYSTLSHNLAIIMARRKFTDQDVAKIVRAIITRSGIDEELEERMEDYDKKFFTMLSYLLFGTEVVRNPASLIFQQMMLDLILQGTGENFTWATALFVEATEEPQEKKGKGKVKTETDREAGDKKKVKTKEEDDEMDEPDDKKKVKAKEEDDEVDEPDDKKKAKPKKKNTAKTAGSGHIPMTMTNAVAAARRLHDVYNSVMLNPYQYAGGISIKLPDVATLIKKEAALLKTWFLHILTEEDVDELSAQKMIRMIHPYITQWYQFADFRMAGAAVASSSSSSSSPLTPPSSSSSSSSLSLTAPGEEAKEKKRGQKEKDKEVKKKRPKDDVTETENAAATPKTKKQRGDGENAKDKSKSKGKKTEEEAEVVMDEEEDGQEQRQRKDEDGAIERKKEKKKDKVRDDEVDEELSNPTRKGKIQSQPKQSWQGTRDTGGRPGGSSPAYSRQHWAQSSSSSSTSLRNQGGPESP